jgi:preprotein translocase subunit YajC
MIIKTFNNKEKKMIKLLTFLAATSASFAMAPQAQGGDPGQSMVMTFVMFGAIILIMYFMMIRPQQKRQKEHQKMLNELKKGDKVITNAGMHGTIKEIDGNTYVIAVADNVAIKFEKSAIVGKETSK